MFHSERTDVDLQGGRSMVLARRGMVCASQPLAAAAGCQVLRDGGNAVDAAICTAATLGVVEPFMTGIGGDCFMLIWSADERKLYGLNGSGRAPRTASVEAVRALGTAQMPMLGIHAVTVPGAVDAWETARCRFGSLPLARLLEPAIEYAEEGFPVSEIITYQWGLAAALLHEDEARRVMMPDGVAPRLGDVIRFPDLGVSLRAIARGGADEFYRGELARRIADASRRRNGFLEEEDLRSHSSTWVEPLSTDYRGVEVCEIPPNGQGLAALLALNILESFDLADGNNADALHFRIEAVKLAYADRNRYIADPEHARVPIGELLSKDYAQGRAAQIDRRKAAKNAAPGALPVGTDTVYLCAADGRGNMVSLINSLFFPFGSGVVAEGTGIALQNRGYGFSLDPRHPNCIAPGKRPFHTIIPAMLLRNGRPWVAFGVMGGDMQAQGHVQVVSNLVDETCSLQEAVDRPRFHYLQRDRVAIEPGLLARAGADLARRGHVVENTDAALGHGGFGGAQAIAVDEQGSLWGASDPRKDGAAIGF